MNPRLLAIVATVAIVPALAFCQDSAKSLETKPIEGLRAVRITVTVRCGDKECPEDSVNTPTLKTKVELRLRRMGIEVATLGHPTIEPIAVFSFHVVTGIGIKDAAIYKATFEVGAMETIRGKQLLVGLWRHDSIGIVGIKSAQERFENEISRALDDFENDWLAANPGVRPGRR